MTQFHVYLHHGLTPIQHSVLIQHSIYYILKCESASSRFQPDEALLRDCEKLREGSFPALVGSKLFKALSDIIQSGGRDGDIYIRDARTSAGQRGDVTVVTRRHAAV